MELGETGILGIRSEANCGLVRALLAGVGSGRGSAADGRWWQWLREKGEAMAEKDRSGRERRVRVREFWNLDNGSQMERKKGLN